MELVAVAALATCFALVINRLRAKNRREQGDE